MSENDERQTAKLLGFLLCHAGRLLCYLPAHAPPPPSRPRPLSWHLPFLRWHPPNMPCVQRDPACPLKQPPTPLLIPCVRAAPVAADTSCASATSGARRWDTRRTACNASTTPTTSTIPGWQQRTPTGERAAGIVADWGKEGRLAGYTVCRARDGALSCGGCSLGRAWVQSGFGCFGAVKPRPRAHPNVWCCVLLKS